MPQGVVRSLVGIFFFLAALLCCIRSVYAFTGDLDTADAHFHLAESALMHGRYDDAQHEYFQVVEVSRTLDLDVREWFCGNAYYGMAICAAFVNDTAATRHWLDEAMVHRYWMFGAVQTNARISSVAGKDFVDSTCKFWAREREEKRARWRVWDPIVLYPSTCGPLRTRPTIVALHGGYGNLRQFASHWQSVANELCALIIIPPGTDRPSPVAFSWDFDMGQIDSTFLELIHRPSLHSLIDTQRLYLAGFSQGGHGALGLTKRHPDMIRGAIVIEGFNINPLDSVVAKNLRAHHSRFYGIFGELGYKPFIESFHRFVAECDTQGIETHVDVVPDMVHELPNDLPQRMKAAVEWIDAKPSSGKHPDMGISTRTK